MNKIIILGSGTSTGIPILGCSCEVCQSRDTRNKRLRTSALIQSSHGKNILIDATPDLRTQLLLNKISSIDATIITHDHADHTHGMDDLRPFTFKTPNDLPVYCDETTAELLRQKFSYIFDREKVFADKAILGGGIPLMRLHPIKNGIHTVAQMDLEFFSLPHGHGETMCLRHEKMAYIVDCKNIPEETLKKLRDAQLDLLIIDCLRPLPHQTHLHFDLTLEYIKAIGPKLAVLTHMGHEWEHLDLIRRLKTRGCKNILPAIDGQVFCYSY